VNPKKVDVGGLIKLVICDTIVAFLIPNSNAMIIKRHPSRLWKIKKSNLY